MGSYFKIQTCVIFHFVRYWATPETKNYSPDLLHVPNSQESKNSVTILVCVWLYGMWLLGGSIVQLLSTVHTRKPKNRFFCKKSRKTFLRKKSYINPPTSVMTYYVIVSSVKLRRVRNKIRKMNRHKDS